MVGDLLHRLRLRHKVLLIVATSAVFVLCGLMILSDHLIQQQFGVQDKKTALTGVEQSRDWIRDRTKARGALAADWGTWDDLYRYLTKPNPEFRSARLGTKDLKKSHIDLFLLLDTNGEVIESICPFASKDSTSCPNSWIAPFQSQAILWSKALPSVHSGVIGLGYFAFSIGFAEVMPHTFAAHRNGFVVIGERLHTSEIPIPRGLGRLDLLPTGLHSDSLTTLKPAGPDSIEGRTLLAGIPGLPHITLLSKTPRILYQEGKQALFYLVAWMLLLGSLIALAMTSFLRISVIGRIESLQKDLERVGQEGHGARVLVRGKDDIGDLCQQVNRTLEQLDHAKTEFETHRHFDPVTGLPNRIHFLNVLAQQALHATNTQAPSFSMILVSLNRFQRICDAYGAHVGEEILIEATRRLQKNHGTNFLARIAQGEFAVLTELADEMGAFTNLADTLRNQLEQPFVIHATMQEVSIHVSIGISMAHDMIRHSADEILRRGEMSLHNLQREDTLSGIALFDPETDRRARDQMDLEKDLHRALENHEFAMAYQPIIALATGNVAGFEALIRWNHPTRGLISPCSFIPLAEETGLIENIGEWVLRESCRQLASWSKLYPQVASTFLSVNLSVRQFRDPRLISKIWHAVQGNEFPFERLKLEITESAMMDDPLECSRRLRSLTELGIRLSLDDFGTGFSSLGYLDRFPVSTIKLDKSFIDKLLVNPNSPIVRAVATLAQTMGFDLIAEGVEKESQADALHKMGCGYVQGYLFAKPMFSDVANLWIRDLP